MNIKNIVLAVGVIAILILLFPPTYACGAPSGTYICVNLGWQPLWDMGSASIDFGKLLITEAVLLIGGGLIIYLIKNK